MSTKSNFEILRYPCTLVGYVRLALVGSAVGLQLLFISDSPQLRPAFVALVGVSLLLDALDGYLARKYNHATHFGALFDLLIDLTTHTVVWFVSGFFLAPALILLEWAGGLYMAAFTTQPYSHWKTTLIDKGPRLIKYYFSRNQRNPLSIYSNICHFAFPMALYLHLPAGWPHYLTLPGLILYQAVTLYLLLVLMTILLQLKE